MMRQVTLCYLVNDEEILMGMKKRGFGEGKLNGYGGKLKPNEALKTGAVRELSEECGVETSEEELQKVGEIAFYFPEKPEWDQVVHIYLVESWSGEPQETDEMRPAWYRRDDLPFDEMWDIDRHFLPKILDGKSVKGNATYSADQKLIEHTLETTPLQ